MPLHETISFTNYNRHIEHPYVIYIYIDFESILTKINMSKPIQKDNISYINKTQKHIPYEFTIYLVSRVDKTFYIPKCYRTKTEN